MEAFKAYDIRGLIHKEVNDSLVRKIAKSIPLISSIRKIVVGHDTREYSKVLCDVFCRNFPYQVYNLGEVSTEEIYFASKVMDVHLGISFTASHNSIDYAGMKFILANGNPITNEFLEFLEKEVQDTPDYEQTINTSVREQFIDFVKEFTKWKQPSGHIVVNCCQGTAGNLLKQICPDFIFINSQTTSFMSDWEPNPMSVLVREETAKAVHHYNADYGVIFDGDNDRCVIMRPDGRIVEGYYFGGLLMSTLPFPRVLHDTNAVFNTRHIACKRHIQICPCRTGHVFMKRMMRRNNCDYGFEFSGHNYFKEFAYCDSGIIPFLLFDRIENKFEQIEEMEYSFPCSHQVSLKTTVPFNVNTASVVNLYENGKIDLSDGIALEFDNWRFCLRQSGTESKLRLTVESKGNKELVNEKLEEIKEVLL